MADRVASGAARTLSHSLNLWAPPGLSGQSGRLHISTNFIGEALSISGAAQEERVGTWAPAGGHQRVDTSRISRIGKGGPLVFVQDTSRLIPREMCV